MPKPRQAQPRPSTVHQETTVHLKTGHQDNKAPVKLQEDPSSDKTKMPNSHQNNNDSKSSQEDEQIKFHQKLLQAQKKSANELLKTTVPGLLSPKLFSAEQVEAMQLMQAHQVQAQMQQVYQQVTLQKY